MRFSFSFLAFAEYSSDLSVGSDLETVVRGCEKLVKKKSSIWKRLNKATRVSQVKENIRELKEKVRDAKMSYLVCHTV